MSATVIPAHENQEAFLASFVFRGKELPGGERLERLRRRAIERFGRLGFPTTRNEDWKYTNLAPYLRPVYEPAGAAEVELSGLPFTDLDCPRLVFVNGRYAPELSSGGELRGVKAGSLKQAIESGAAERHLARYADFENHAMAALNTAFLEDGAYIDIADGAVMHAPLYLLFISAPGGRPSVAYPRNLVVAGRDSQARIIEGYVGPGDTAYFTNAVTEVAAADGAIVEHYKLQAEGAQAVHFGLLRVEQGASSNFVSHNLAMGAALARNEIAVRLAGEGGECVLNGLYAASGEQHIDNYTTLEHVEPHTTSHELYKGILDGKAQGVFHGRIIVRPAAQKTDAIQRNKNLLLSKDAVINTKPQLEIYADDVRCTHGATVGQVNDDAVFYLRSRGIPLDDARKLLTYAFAAELIDIMKVEALRTRLGEALFRSLA